MARNKMVLSTRKYRMYEQNSKFIKFLRRNPVMACEILLGIKLLDYQKYILIGMWNAPYTLISCSRNSGKSFLGAVFMILKALLYENQAIYIISSVGSQAQETFSKIEEIILRVGKTSSSIASLKDIAAGETVKSPSCRTGFVHAQTGFHVEFYNGSEIMTLNGNPDNNRSKRATLVFFDEAGFSSDELISISEAFATQDSNFITSTNEDFNIKTLRKKCPTQLVYASSASDVDTTFWRKYKDFTKRMIAGDTRYFVCDIPCTVPIEPLMDGLPHPPLLQKSKVEAAMRANKEKAMREYYNIFAKDFGENQVIKWSMIRRNESLLLPELEAVPGCKYAVAFDPARSMDNSILGVMKIIEDKNIGYYGEIVNCTNFVEIGNKKGYKMSSPEQVKALKESIVAYNGRAPDYQNIYVVLIDSGAGGGGISAYADNMLEDWTDKKGIKHKGFLDTTYEAYAEYGHKYPHASDVLKLIVPQRMRTVMFDELVELMQLDLIKFTKEYDGRGFVPIQEEKDGVVTIKNRPLTIEEEVALMNIDLMKTEITSIFKFENPEKTSKRYALPKDKERILHDDRSFVLAMLGHYLYQMRHDDVLKRSGKQRVVNWMDFVMY
jgi:hypothetical protein